MNKWMHFEGPFGQVSWVLFEHATRRAGKRNPRWDLREPQRFTQRLLRESRPQDDACAGNSQVLFPSACLLKLKPLNLRLWNVCWSSFVDGGQTQSEPLKTVFSRSTTSDVARSTKIDLPSTSHAEGVLTKAHPFETRSHERSVCFFPHAKEKIQQQN